jgi:hypothetical protein
MAMSIRRLFFLTAVVALAAILVIAGPAAAAKKKKRKKHPNTFATNATLTFVGGAFFNGDVTSKRAECEQGRLVTLTYFDPTGVPPTPIGVERTNSKGRATFNVSPFAYPGTYQVTVAPDKHRIRGRIITCRQTESPKLGV